MKQLQRRRIVETLHQLGQAMAVVGKDLANAQKDARADEDQELIDFYARMAAQWAYSFLEMTAIPAEIPILVYNMEDWADTFANIHGHGWTDAQQARFHYLLGEYQALVAQAKGTPAVLAQPERDGSEYFIAFETAEHEEDEE